MSRRDDVDLLYRKSKKLNDICQVLFWSNCILSVISSISTGLINNMSVLIQILVSFAYIVMRNLDDGHFWYNAESSRRKNNFQVAFGISLSNLETDGYYNNTLEPSITKYAMNTFESNFFCKELSGKMLIGSFIKSMISIALLIVIGWFTPNGDILLVITQAVFSAYIIEETIMLTLYKWKMDRLYETAYTEFITVGISKISQQNLLLSYVVEYEAVKAHYKVRINSSLFAKYNEELSAKWNDIKSKCVIKSRLSK